MQSFNPFIEIFNKVVKPDFKKLPQETKWMIDDLKKSYKELIGYVFISLLIVSIQTNILADYTSEELGMLEIYRLLNYSIVNNWLISFIVLVTISYIYIYKIYALQLVPTIISRIRFCLIIFLYIFIFRQSNLFYCFEDYPSIYYVDALIFYLGAFSLKLQPYKSYRPISDSIFIEENAKIKLEDDKLKRAEYSESIVDEINNLKTENSFSIAVIGEWGSGKSTFMSFLKETLEKDNRNLIIHFNPWKVKNTDLMLDDFFTSFVNKVEELDHDLKRNISKYSRYLTESEFKDNWIINSFRFILTFIDKSKSVTEQLEEINFRLEQTGKKFIVFIDDIDRLTGEEIFQILKLLRTTADFKNVVFIAGIDLEYVQQSIEKSSLQIHKSDKYLNKIFQLEIFLPPFDKSTVVNEVIKLLKVQNTDLITIENCLREISAYGYNDSYLNNNLLEIYLNSYREVTRFVNSFNLSYKMVGDYVDLYDLILIELLKIKYPIIYQKFGDKSLLEKYSLLNQPSDGRYTIKVNKHLIETYFGNDKENISSILNEIYPPSNEIKSTHKTYKSIIYRENHDLYYNYLNIGKVGGKEFERIILNPINVILNEVEILKEQNRFNDFYKKLMDKISKVKFKNDEIEPLILIWIELYDAQNDQVKEAILRKIISQKSFTIIPNKEKIIEIFIKYLKNKTIKVGKRIELAHEYLLQCLKARNKQTYTIDNPEIVSKIKRVNYENFTDFIANCTKISYEVFRLYYSNIDYIKEDSSIVINQEANKLFRKFIYEHKEDYLKILLRPLYSPPNERYVFEPFLKQTFGNDEEKNGFENFEKFVDEFEGNEKLKGFIKKHFEKYKESKSEPKSVILEEEEIKYLNEIQAKFKTE